MHSLVATTSSNPLKSLTKICVIEDVLLGSCWDVVVVVELLFPIYTAECVGGCMKCLLCSCLYILHNMVS